MSLMEQSVIKLSRAEALDTPGGTSLQAVLSITYAQLIDRFGEPTFPNGDDDKVDREWVFHTPKGIVTVYNYKTGPNFNRELPGVEVERIGSWHVGAKSNEIAQEFLKLVELSGYEEPV